jgi:E3 ubiquitin-protein ligase HERC2
VVECLRGKKIVHVAVGALHCLAVTETGQVPPDFYFLK